MDVKSKNKINVWCLTLFLVLMQVFFTNVLQAGEGSDWQKMISPKGECGISFPCQPQIIQQNLPIQGTNSKLSYDVYLAPNEDKGVFLLLVATYPVSLSGGHEISGLEGLLSGIVNHHPENQLIYADMTELMGKPAIDFLVEGGGSYFRGQAVMSGNKLFLIAMEGFKNELNEQVFNQFLKSFKLNP